MGTATGTNEKQLEEIEGTQLSEVVQRNTALTSLQKNAFFWQG